MDLFRLVDKFCYKELAGHLQIFSSSPIPFFVLNFRPHPVFQLHFCLQKTGWPLANLSTLLVIPLVSETLRMSIKYANRKLVNVSIGVIKQGQTKHRLTAQFVLLVI